MMRSARHSIRLVLGLALLMMISGTAVGWARYRSAPPPRYLVIIVADGFRPDYLNLVRMPHLQALMNRGMTYTQGWVGQLETETPTSHATIGTGAYPKKHGVVGFVWRDPTGQNITWMPSDSRELDAGDMERLIESGGVPSLADVMHRASPGAKVASMSGEKFYAADAMGVGADYILYGKGKPNSVAVTAVGQHVLPGNLPIRSWYVHQPAYAYVQDQFSSQLAVHLLQTVRPRIMLVNLPGVDIQGHITGGVNDPKDMAPVVQGVDAALGRIEYAYWKAGLWNQTDFVFTADHGMLPNRSIAPTKAMYAGVRASGAPWLEDDFLSTAGYVFLRNPRQAHKVARFIAAQHYPNVEGALYKVVTPNGFSCRAESSTAKRLGPQLTQAYTDLCNTVMTTDGPDVILPYTVDTLGLVQKGSAHWGTHGGLQWRTLHIPLILAGPGIKHGSSSFPAQLVDIAPTAERLMSLPIPAGVDGVVLSDALASASNVDRTAQTRVAPRRQQDVAALEMHSLQTHALILSTPNSPAVAR